MRMWLTILALGIAAGTAAFTVARTKITGGFRTWTTRKSSWLGNLVSCPYCLSHWFAATAVLIYQPTVVHQWIVTDLGVSWLMAVAVATFTFGLIGKAIKAQA